MNYVQAISAFAHALNHEGDTNQPPAASGLHFAQRMRHYRANCRLNRIAALQATFSTVEQLLGADFFRAMAREYVDVTPATSANLHDMGDDFPGFIAQFTPAAALPYLPDVALLDWARWQAWLAPDAPELAADQLAFVASDDFASYRLQLHPAMQLVASANWPIADILAMHDGGPSANLDAGGQKIMISRYQWQTVSDGQWAFFSALQQQASVGDALEQALAVDERTDINQALLWLFQQQLVCAADRSGAVCEDTRPHHA
ncbi:DNA-binding domain-containing protein [Chitinibacter sp. FCG-7]|uniref:DNA-binding domain-containing protein n=1 Tax=Chitinibacter mangrovi TaxID=3153927 RepID=A0AAU7F819_9NEIS